MKLLNNSIIILLFITIQPTLAEKDKEDLGLFIHNSIEYEILEKFDSASS